MRNSLGEWILKPFSETVSELSQKPNVKVLTYVKQKTWAKAILNLSNKSA